MRDPGALEEAGPYLQRRGWPHEGTKRGAAGGGNRGRWR